MNKLMLTWFHSGYFFVSRTYSPYQVIKGGQPKGVHTAFLRNQGE